MCTQQPIGLKLLVGILFIFIASCGRQTSEDVFTQINARLDQLEQKMVQLDNKDGELTASTNDATATLFKLEERISALSQQLEKTSARPPAPAAGKTAPSPADMSQGKKHHTVARGETLYSIARRYGRSVDELRRLNNLSQGQTIQTGQKLVVAPER